ncbi:hypothetical protein ACFLQY_03690 [Verrucomicrobiota bacterium]
MEKPRKIQLHEKLLEREEQFARVHSLEQQIMGILGEQPYPFELRDDLPSLQKRKKPKKKKDVKHKVARLRKLTDDEAAYRVTYLQGMEERTELHQLAAPIELLINRAIGEITILRVCAIDPDQAETEVLFDIHRA